MIPENLTTRPEFARENGFLLQVRDLCKYYPLKGGFFEKAKGVVKAVDGISFEICKGQTLGLVGESGCGKTTTGRMILRVIEPTRGQILINVDEKANVNLTALSPKAMRLLRRKIQMIFQDPNASLDPRMTVMQIIGEPLRAGKRIPKNYYKEKIAETIRLVGLRTEFMNRYPHAFSGGQRQRIGIARALVTEPALIVADEPVSALDVSVQAQILNLLKDLQVQLQLTYLFIAHDLSVIRYICDRIAVMYVGKLVEVADRSALFSLPKHPYTETLMSAIPQPDPRRKTKHVQIKGSVADASNPPSGCYFHPRCQYKQEICQREAPRLRESERGHFVACHFDLDLKGIAQRA